MSLKGGQTESVKVEKLRFSRVRFSIPNRCQGAITGNRTLLVAG